MDTNNIILVTTVIILTILIIFAGKRISNLQKEVNTLNKCCDAERKKYSTYILEHPCLTVRELIDKANFRYGALFIDDSFGTRYFSTEKCEDKIVECFSVGIQSYGDITYFELYIQVK